MATTKVLLVPLDEDGDVLLDYAWERSDYDEVVGEAEEEAMNDPGVTYAIFRLTDTFVLSGKPTRTKY